ncbi:alanine--tRNA ligase [Ahrensia marina]|uniref:alanine--tRNA ligase n=1 Tax=Ahrensia marina TaxID=1514904 RepID=UPI0035D0863D
MSSVNEIRSAFLSYFEKHGHAVLPSSPLVPRNDPTLMFTNAGMVQFKNVFTGLETREPPRAATSQKCVRAGGKHNDLDNVGYTARHHTFFEMLGNFSFGDYFKEEAIYHSWNLVTKDFDINPDKLLVTVYADDDEAFDLWGKIAGLPDEKIIRIGTSDNFWAMGDTGPCGPCSEIFYDHGPSIPGGPPGSPDEDGDRFIEIWNLVFMQYEQVDADNRIALPKPSIDTGMGLERLAALLQGKHDNYDTDLFQSLIAASVDLTGVSAEGDAQASHRVIADHLRATSFLIADGVLPSNEGRGYVLRRIMRRAMRHAHLLGAKDPVLHRLVPALLREMGEAYPELDRARALISETLELEENRFKKMLDRGLGLLDDASKTLSDGDTFDGEVAFKLYDTYGFPLDLTQDALRSRAISVDTNAFDAAMERQRADARAAWAGSGDAGTDTVWFAVRDAHGASEFLGYDTLIAEGVLVAAVKDGAEVEALKPGEEGAVVVNQTPFYAESGGQQGDQGTIKQGDALFTVRDTVKRADGVFVHMGTVSGTPLKVGEPVDLAVDGVRRQAIRSNHSATHLLHEALRETLGDHVAQKGSLVAPDRLRFDFSHPKPIEADELSAIEDISNRMILQDSPVETRLMDVDSAIESGARALFGEKYGDEVRVVSMGDKPDGSTFSVELCGGTHVGRTGEIGLVRVVSEGAVAAGVRRVEALTGEAARAYLSDQDTRVKAIASRLKVTPDQALERVDALMEERRKLEREVAELKKQVALGGGGQQATAQEDVAGIAFSGRVLDGVSPKDLKGIADEMKRELGSGVVTLVATGEGKAAIVVGVTDDLTGSHSAVDLVRAGSAALGGKGGGGRPDMAQAGGPDASKAEAALEAVKSALAG